MEPLLRLSGLSRVFWQRQGLLRARTPVPAVDEVDLDVRAGEIVGLVGESGSGKSTLARMVMGLLEPTSGEVRLEGRSLYDRSEHRDYARFRREVCRKIQMVFQDPYSSLDPRMRIGESVAEPLLCTGLVKDRAERTRRVAAMLEQVGIGAAMLRRYPHEFSGGQRQRIAIARALITRPLFVVCDEPTSSLDSSVQAQVLNLLLDMREELGLAYLFISHDLAVVRHMSDRVAVMYAGRIVEEASTGDLFEHPSHPYTRVLLASVPGYACAEKDAPVDACLPGACAFAPRCVSRQPVCLERPAPVRQLHGGSGPEVRDDFGAAHRVRCHFPRPGRET